MENSGLKIEKCEDGLYRLVYSYPPYSTICVGYKEEVESAKRLIEKNG